MKLLPPCIETGASGFNEIGGLEGQMGESRRSEDELAHGSFIKCVP
jgi:hypothetical protein